jgi:[acyl-carrier-protein] S-malonyltransferase
MKTAWLFAGQGSQKLGMGQDFYNEFESVRPFFDSDVCGFDIKEICFGNENSSGENVPENANANGGNAPETANANGKNAPENATGEIVPEIAKINQTCYTQPCMAAFAAGVVSVLKGKGLAPDYVAGLSLGEYCALHAAGVLDAKTLLETLAFRGKVMEESAKGIQSKMTAILGLHEDSVKSAVQKASSSLPEKVYCANFNCPGQIVICGEIPAVELAEKFCLEAGAKRCIPLNTSGPFHTPFMQFASEKLAEKFETVKFNPQSIPVLFNATADFAEDSDIPKLLTEQVKSPVLFEKIIRKLSELGVTNVVEIGPGRALSGFVKKTDSSIKCVSIETVADIEKVVNG